MEDDFMYLSPIQPTIYIVKDNQDYNIEVSTFKFGQRKKQFKIQ